MTNLTAAELLAKALEFIAFEEFELHTLANAVQTRREALQHFKAEITNEPEDLF